MPSVMLLVVRYRWTTALVVLLMFPVAAWTSARRIVTDAAPAPWDRAGARLVLYRVGVAAP